ncbi:MAG: biotin transporter BioY [Limnochordia bacterium]|jgi:biotin transport system substrate-specific component
MVGKNLLRIPIFAALTALLAFIYIPLPFSPVPVTGQTMGPLLAGIYLGSRAGAVSQIIYLGLGLIGLPVFAGGTAGPGTLVGPTGGYIWGFILSALLVGRLWQPRTSRGRQVFILCLGMLVIYLLGIVQLSLVMGLPLGAAWQLGALPFLIGDSCKIMAILFFLGRLPHL